MSLRPARLTGSTAEMGYYPVLLDLAGRRCVMVGGGLVAERRVDGLLAAGAQVVVISPRLTRALDALAAAARISHEPRGYREGDLAGADLVFVATDTGEVNAAVAREARERGLWVNAADDPARCDFILPSVLRRGDLTVAVSSGGRSPALARTIREELELYFTDEYALLANLAAEVRDELRARGIDAPFETWRRALTGDVRQLLMRGDVARAKILLLREFGVSA